MEIGHALDRVALDLPGKVDARADPIRTLGHLHAAPFKYRPLQKGLIELEKTVRPLFEGESAQGIVHLLADDRDPGNIEQSKLVRGACWFAPLHLEH